jgi:murein DD-endopeptidase MepM/ murein hydrolase activator NlpD
MTYLARSSPGALGCCGFGMGDVFDVGTPVPGRPQTPIFPFRFNPRGGGFGQVRNSLGDGGCPNQNYPCTHPGIDVAAPAGTVVVAPEDGTVVRVADGSSSPFGGYGPWVIVLAGASGRFHLLAHLSPATSSSAPLGQVVRAGDRVGTVAFDHTHWEVRKKAIPDFAAGDTNMTNNESPLLWLSLAKVGLGGVSATSLLLLAGGAAALLGAILYRRRKA